MSKLIKSSPLLLSLVFVSNLFVVAGCAEGGGSDATDTGDGATTGLDGAASIDATPDDAGDARDAATGPDGAAPMLDGATSSPESDAAADPDAGHGDGDAGSPLDASGMTDVGGCLDGDSDGVCDIADACPAGDDGVDTDSDGVADACDRCESVADRDAFEDNNSIADAVTMPLGSPLQGSICEDDDYFAVPLAAGCTLDAELSYAPASGELDLALVDSAGSVLAASTSDTGREQLSEMVGAAGTYYLRVFGFGGASNAYQLTTSSRCPPSCPADDSLEPNDSLGAATMLSPGTVASGVICEDPDFYRVRIGPGCTVSASLSFTHSLGDLDLRMRAPSGAVVTTSAGSTNQEALEVTVGFGNDYVLEVFGFQGASTHYSLSTEVDCTLSCPRDDGFEPNDLNISAVPLMSGQTARGIICAENDDYYAVSIGAGCSITALLDFTDANGDLDLGLFNAQGVALATSTGTADDEIVSHTATTSGTYYLLVVGYLDAQNDYELTPTITCP